MVWSEIGSFVTGIGIHAEDIALVRRYRSDLSQILPGILDSFYDHWHAIGHGDRLAGTDVRSLKARQLAHWDRLFDGIFDQVYEDYGRRIGAAHRSHGISQDLYMQAYGWLTGRLFEAIEASPAVPPAERMALARAVTRFIFFDMTVAMTTYHVVYID